MIIKLGYVALPEPVQNIDFTPSYKMGYRSAINDAATGDVEVSEEEAAEVILKEWKKYDRLNVQMSSREEAVCLSNAMLTALPGLMKAVRVEGK